MKRSAFGVSLFLAFLGFFLIRRYATEDERPTAAELHGFSGAAVSYATRHDEGISPVSRCCDRPASSPYRGIMVASRTTAVRRLGTPTAMRLVVNCIAPHAPLGQQWRQSRGIMYTFWMSSTEVFDANALREGRLPQSATKVERHDFLADSIGFTTWGSVSVLDYGAQPLAAWLPVAKSVVSLQYFPRRRASDTSYIFLREDIEKPKPTFLERTGRFEYPSMDVAADDIVISRSLRGRIEIGAHVRIRGTPAKR